MSKHTKSNGNGDGLDGWGRRPGEYIERHVTEGTESDLIEKQAWIFTRSMFVIQFMLALIVLVCWLAFGPVVVAACGESVIILACWVWYKLLERDAIQNGRDTVEVGFPIMAWAITSLVLFFTWPGMLDAIDLRTGLMLLALALTVYFSMPFVVPRVFLSWRMAAEIVDIGISRAAVTGYVKPIWPWTRNDEVVPPEPVDPPAPDFVGAAVHPLVIHDNGHTPPKPRTWTSATTGLTWPVIDRPRVAEREGGRKYVLSPTGEYLSVTDLMFFIQTGIRGGAGASYRKWKRDKRQRPNGLSEERWRSIVHYLAEIGVVSVPRDKETTVFIVDSVRAATDRLMDDLDATPPPPQADEPVQVDEGLTDRQQTDSPLPG